MTVLSDRIAALNLEHYYFFKDLKKAQRANKFIGRGSAPSSTNKYMKAAGDLANCGEYEYRDNVFVSAEGNRTGRVEVDYEELGKAVAARATFITDDFKDRNRPYNVGERNVVNFLIKHGYMEITPGMWKPPAKEF